MAMKDYTPLLDAAQDQLGLTFSSSDSLDTKALAVLAANLALFIFTLQSETGGSWWLLAALFLSLGISSLLTVLVIWPRGYAGAIVDLSEHPEYFQFDQTELVLKLLANTQEATATNTRLNNRKSTCCGLAIAATLIGIGFLVGCIL